MSHVIRLIVLLYVMMLVACCRAPEPKVDLKAEENKAIVRDFFASIDNGNLDRIKELVADDFALNAPGLTEPWGADMLFQAIKTHYASFPDWTHVIEDIIAEGDKVAVKLTQYGTHKAEYDGIPATGNKVIMPAMHLTRIVDGKIKEWWAIEDNLGLMQQLGMELKPKEKDSNYARLFQKQLELIGEMRLASVQFLAGTDTGAPYLIPGFSLHEELVFLVRGGLTTMEALQTATINPARFLDMLDSLGTVEVGKIADLVLLEANPLEDISNTQRINAVVLGGKFLPKESLQKMLDDVEVVVSRM